MGRTATDTTTDASPEGETIPVWTVGDRLAKARRTAGLERSDMAAALGCDVKTIGNYETGRTRIRRPAIEAWARRCRVPSWWIEGDDPDNVTPLRGQPDTLSSTSWYTENPCMRPVTLAAA